MAGIPAPDPALSDGRVSVRAPVDGDVPAITGACQDPEIQRFTMVPSPYTADDARFFVAMSRDGFRDGSQAAMVVVDAQTEALLGACGIVRYSARDLVAEVGYWVAREARGRGVATAATRLVCRWAFGELGAERIHLEAAVENEASNAVARAVGFTAEGTLRSAASIGHDGTAGEARMDLHVYGLLPGELR